jgi:hypothetical protein
MKIFAAITLVLLAGITLSANPLMKALQVNQ